MSILRSTSEARAPGAFFDTALLVGRILVVAALVPNGLRKIMTFEQTALAMGGSPQMMNGRVFPAQQPLFDFVMPELFLAAAIGMDLIASALVIVGWHTRIVALALALYCLAAITIFHWQVRGPEDAVALLRNLTLVGGLLYVAAVGAGHWSLDGGRGRGGATRGARGAQHDAA